MADTTDRQDSAEEIRRDSNGAIDYRYYLLRGRQVRAETVWALLRQMLGNRDESKNQQ